MSLHRVRYQPFRCMDIASAATAVVILVVIFMMMCASMMTHHHHHHHQVTFQVNALCTHRSTVTIKTTSSGFTQNTQEVSKRYRLQQQYAATEPSTDQENNKINSKLSSSKNVGSLQSQEEFNKPNAGESCSLDHHDDDPNTAIFTSMIQDNSYLDSSQKQQNTITSEENIFLNPVFIIPIFTPFLAYLTYDDVARVFSAIFDILALERKWVPVDGGAYQAKIIAPAINGIVVPAISILFATLTSNTVSTLRQRQIDIHTYLNSEAGDLRLLVLLLDVFPESELKTKCRQYLYQYTCRLIAESEDSKTSKVMFGSTDSEMNGFAAILNELIVDRDGESSSNSIRPPETILSESFGAVVRLNTIRSSRITALQSTFPILHYGILTLLAASICLAFLLETNQELLIFLNAIQLRILWTMLIGAISALGVVCWDLSFPFAGSYVISNAVDQLKTIRDTLRAGQSKAI